MPPMSQWARMTRALPPQVVRARRAVVATNSPINGRVTIHSKMAPYRTYAMAFSLPRGALGDALYWDTADGIVTLAQ